jgi:glutathione S-transferase
MKLYNLQNSPFATRVRAFIRHKNLDVEICDPPQALRTAEFAEAFALAKLPVLALGDGDYLSESTVIMDYLEDLHPSQPLVPTEALARAQNRMLERCADTHLGPGLFPLFSELMAPSTDPSVIEQKFEALSKELGKLQNLLAALPDYNRRSLQTGDICLATTVYYVGAMADHFGRGDLLANYPGISSWWDWVNGFPAVIESLEEMAAAHNAFIQRLQGAS